MTPAPPLTTPVCTDGTAQVAQLSGHGEAFGVFVVQELLWRLITSTRSILEHLELANDALGDAGAIAVSRAMVKLTDLVTIDLSANDIGPRGATAIYEALSQVPSNSKLKSVTLDDNPAIPPAL